MDEVGEIVTNLHQLRGFLLTTQPSILNAYNPVGFADELGPALHAIHSIGVDRLPSWTHWLLAEFHVRLSWSPVCLRQARGVRLQA